MRVYSGDSTRREVSMSLFYAKKAGGASACRCLYPAQCRQRVRMYRISDEAVLLKNEWADIIASDAHNMSDRPNRLSQCYEYIEKKFDEDYAKLLFEQNPGQITSSIADE